MTDNYNGWTNYETWCVNLWITNDQGTQSYWGTEAHTVLVDAKEIRLSPDHWTAEERATFSLADTLKETIESQSPLLRPRKNPLLGSSACLYCDLLNAALSEVNWREIAAALIETQSQTI